MACLKIEEASQFEDFISWRSDACSHLGTRHKAWVYLILFGRHSTETHTDEICGQYSGCKSCVMFQHDRCHEYVKKRFSETPSKMRDIMKTDYARGDFEFYEKIESKIKGYMTELCMIVGSYRIELFLEELRRKAIKSAELHNKVNPNDKVHVPKEETPKYYSLNYIRENDMWSMFKETQIEGELLCSLLSDF